MPVLLNCRGKCAGRRPAVRRAKAQRPTPGVSLSLRQIARSFLWRRLKPTPLNGERNEMRLRHEDGVEGGVGGAIPVAGVAGFALRYCCTLICARLAARPFDGADDVVAGCGIERLEFAGGAL
jgi:hypothetical protein